MIAYILSGVIVVLILVIASCAYYIYTKSKEVCLLKSNGFIKKPIDPKFILDTDNILLYAQFSSDEIGNKYINCISNKCYSDLR